MKGKREEEMIPFGVKAKGVRGGLVIPKGSAYSPKGQETCEKKKREGARPSLAQKGTNGPMAGMEPP